MKTKDVKVGMKFADYDVCTYEVVGVGEDGVSVRWLSHAHGCSLEGADQHGKQKQHRDRDQDWLMWAASSNKPDTLLNPEQFSIQNKDKTMKKYKHTVEFTTDLDIAALTSCVHAPRATIKVVKTEEVPEPFPVGYKYRHSGDSDVLEVRYYDAEWDAGFVKDQDGHPGYDHGADVREAEEVK